MKFSNSGMDGVEIAKTANLALDLLSTPAPATSGGPLPATVDIVAFLDAIKKYPVPPSTVTWRHSSKSHPNLNKAMFLCGKQGAMDFQESYFLYLTGVDPDLNLTMAAIHKRFLLVQLTLVACNKNGVLGEVENAFLAAIHERAHSTDLTAHTKQLEFFQIWYNNPDFKVQCLHPLYRTRLTNLSKKISAYMIKNRWKMENGKLRAMKVMAKLLSPTLTLTNSRQLCNSAINLAFGSGKDARQFIDEKAFN